VVEQLPQTGSGKVDRKRLAELAGENVTAKAKGVKPRTEIEELLAGIWADVLRVETPGALGVEDNFFELGGHSLLATQLISRVRDVFKVELPLRRLFEAPTVVEMAQFIIQRRHDSTLADKIEPIEENDEGLLSQIDQLSSEEVEALLVRALSEAEADT
jgi:acyl carrier protein